MLAKGIGLDDLKIACRCLSEKAGRGRETVKRLPETVLPVSGSLIFCLPCGAGFRLCRLGGRRSCS